MLLRTRLPEDLPAVRQLLEGASLPPDGLERTEGFVIQEGQGLAGHIALEGTEDAAVLRSLVVAPEYRGRRFGEALLEAAESAAQGRVLVLKTDTVGPWMLRRGYHHARLDQCPPSVLTTTQFSGSLCQGTPVYLKRQESAMTLDIKAEVRKRYAGFVTRGTSCCGSTCGCGPAPADLSLKIGYTRDETGAVPEGANLGLGCGNPVAMASLQPGETVLDLGSGAGFDAFLAAQRVGPEGRVIGVDMTPEMIERATGLAVKHGYTQVTFRQGDIEALPVEDASVDAVISNCVINLTTDKAQVFREAYRVLKPGGRLMVSDLVLTGPLPEAVLRNLDAYAACVSGALKKEDYLAAIEAAGFSAVITEETSYDVGDGTIDGLTESDVAQAARAVVSLQVRALKAQG